VEYKETIEHFSEELSEDIKQYATDDVLKYSRYIFYKRKGKWQHGYCTHCRTEFKTNGLYHNGEDECPNCKSRCIAKSSGIGHSKLVDKAYFVYYEKSVIDPNVIVARGIYVERNYRGDYFNVDTSYWVEAVYVFEMGNSVMLEEYYYYSPNKTNNFHKCKTVYSLFSRYHNEGWFKRDTSTRCSYESIRKAIKDTPFQYSCWDDYKYGDMVKFFDLYSRYPCIEYLTKLDMKELVEDKLYSRATYNAINWRGKTIQKVLKLSKKEINEIRKSNVSVDPLFLRLLQLSIKDGSNLSINEIADLKDKYNFDFKALQKLLKYTTLKKVNAYTKKQYPLKVEGKRHYYNAGQVLNTWRDYIADCVTLEMDLTQECVLFPKNLYNAHQNTIKQVKVKADETLNKKISLRAKSLEKYCFEDLGLLTRPASSPLELIEEGKALHHCVGTYANGYAAGDTNIFVIRKTSDPDTPYYTMEIRQDRIAQVRGNRNCAPDKDVARFIDTFTEQKLNKKKARVKVSA